MREIRFNEDNRSGDLIRIVAPGCTVDIQVNLTGPDGRQVTRVDVIADDESRGGDLSGYFWRIATDGAPGVSRVIRDPRPVMRTISPSQTAFSCAWCDADIEQSEVGGGWYDVATAQTEDGTGVPSVASLECDEAPDGIDVPSRGQHIPGGEWLVREARGWIADCFGADVDVALLSDRSVIEGTQRHYEGGWAAFVAASPA